MGQPHCFPLLPTVTGQRSAAVTNDCFPLLPTALLAQGRQQSWEAVVAVDGAAAAEHPREAVEA